MWEYAVPYTFFLPRSSLDVSTGLLSAIPLLHSTHMSSRQAERKQIYFGPFFAALFTRNHRGAHL